MSVHFMSQSVDWSTPRGVYETLNDEFNFNFDPCPLYGADGNNGLVGRWGSSAFVNPPYGRQISLWTSKAVYEWELFGITIVMLLPSRTDTKWWHRDVMQADEIRFIKGRLKFGDAKNSAPFPSCVAVFRGAASE